MQNFYVKLPIECPQCEAKQEVHVIARTGSAQIYPQSVKCVKSNKTFEVMVPDTIIEGPFGL